MAGAACKIIINNGLAAVNSSLEQVLSLPWVRDKIGASKADELLQEMANLDIVHYGGTAEAGSSLTSIMSELIDLGIFTEEIWEIFNNPEQVSKKKNKKEEELEQGLDYLTGGNL